MFYACALDPENCGEKFAKMLVDRFVYGDNPLTRYRALDIKITLFQEFTYGKNVNLLVLVYGRVNKSCSCLLGVCFRLICIPKQCVLELLNFLIICSISFVSCAFADDQTYS